MGMFATHKESKSRKFLFLLETQLLKKKTSKIVFKFVNRCYNCSYFLSEQDEFSFPLNFSLSIFVLPEDFMQF